MRPGPLIVADHRDIHVGFAYLAAGINLLDRRLRVLAPAHPSSIGGTTDGGFVDILGLGSQAEPDADEKPEEESSLAKENITAHNLRH